MKWSFDTGNSYSLRIDYFSWNVFKIQPFKAHCPPTPGNLSYSEAKLNWSSLMTCSVCVCVIMLPSSLVQTVMSVSVGNSISSWTKLCLNARKPKMVTVSFIHDASQESNGTRRLNVPWKLATFRTQTSSAVHYVVWDVWHCERKCALILKEVSDHVGESCS